MAKWERDENQEMTPADSGIAAARQQAQAIREAFTLPASEDTKKVRVKSGHLLAGTEGLLRGEVADVPGVYSVQTTKQAPGRKFPTMGERFRIALTDLDAVTRE